MAYQLFIGEYAYSSWSMRGWLMLDAFDIPFKVKYVPLFTDEFEGFKKDHFPACTVPALTCDDNQQQTTISDSLTIAECLAEWHPEAGLWPTDKSKKMLARSLSAQMHSGFGALRDRPSMNLNFRYQGFEPTTAEQNDANNIEQLWDWALQKYGGPYLMGDSFGAVDAMFAPVATRFVTYGFAMNSSSKSYVENIYALPSFRRWHACADAQLRELDAVHLDLPVDSDNKGWPRFSALPGQKYQGDVADAINENCPYSGLPIAADSVAEIDGVVVGFCNQFCCRRGMADAESWPSVMKAMGRS